MIRRWMPLLEVLWLAVLACFVAYGAARNFRAGDDGMGAICAVLAFLNAGSALALMVEQRFPRRQP